MPHPGGAGRPGLVLRCLAAGLILGACGLAALAWSEWEAWRNLAGRWPQADAIVVRTELHSVGSRSRTPQSYPVLRFTAPDGRVIEARSAAPVPQGAAAPGARLAVVFDPAAPADVRPVSTIAAAPGPVFGAALSAAAVMAALGVLFLWLAARARSRVAEG